MFVRVFMTVKTVNKNDNKYFVSEQSAVVHTRPTSVVDNARVVKLHTRNAVLR